ncbi:hypothetical protein HZS_2683, partial [Henneguya salminicola]
MTRFNEAMLLNGLQKRIKRKVQCKQTNMFSAIKKFRLQLKNTDIELKHIIKEVEMISSLEHDNIVRYEELIINNNDIYLRMEYCIASLYDINRINENFFDEETMIIMLTAIVDALVFIHGKGYIHRDIKCSNILVSVDAKIKLCFFLILILADFGSSSNKSTSSTFAGSPYCGSVEASPTKPDPNLFSLRIQMAPELILTEEEGSYDSKSDIWSLGITLIELAEKIPPRFEINIVSALYIISHESPPELASRKLSENFNKIIKSCLKTNPNDRISSDDLKKFIFDNYNDLIAQNQEECKLKNVLKRSYSKEFLKRTKECTSKCEAEFGNILCIPPNKNSDSLKSTTSEDSSSPVNTHQVHDYILITTRTYLLSHPLQRLHRKLYFYIYFLLKINLNLIRNYQENLKSELFLTSFEDYVNKQMKIISRNLQISMENHRKVILEAKEKQTIYFNNRKKHIKKQYSSLIISYKTEINKDRQITMKLVEDFKKRAIEAIFFGTDLLIDLNSFPNSYEVKVDTRIDFCNTNDVGNYENKLKKILLKRHQVKQALVNHDEKLHISFLNQFYHFLLENHNIISSDKIKIAEKIHLLKMEHDKTIFQIEKKNYIQIKNKSMTAFIEYKHLREKKLNLFLKEKVSEIKKKYVHKINYLKLILNKEGKNIFFTQETKKTGKCSIKKEIEENIKRLRSEQQIDIELCTKDIFVEAEINEEHIILSKKVDSHINECEINHNERVKQFNQNFFNDKKIFGEQLDAVKIRLQQK